jgi:hypothetical protein
MSVHDIEPNLRPVPEYVVREAHTQALSVSRTVVYFVLGVALVCGCISGFLLFSLSSSSTNTNSLTKSGKTEIVKEETKAGIIDKRTFSDTATGILREGGFEGEGSHNLERGSEDQTAYLTSSTVDLDMYVGKKVRVWGKTYKGEKVGWLMDVGLVEIVQ